MDRIARSNAADRTVLFRRTEAAMSHGCHAAIVEKDFWVCWALRRIFEVLQFRPHLIFKGGTSLSKVYRAIERFSEDVDLSLSRRDLGFADEHDPEQTGISKKEARRRLDALVAECQTVVREKLVPELRRDFASVLGGSGLVSGVGSFRSADCGLFVPVYRGVGSDGLRSPGHQAGDGCAVG